MKLLTRYQNLINKLNSFDGLPALLIRLYLAPIFIIAGYNKLQLSSEHSQGFSALFAKPDIVNWFANSEWGLGLPFPELLANLAAWTEFFGGWLLLIGLLTRLITLPLMFTMIIAATTVHADNGWFAIAPSDGSTSSAQVFNWFGLESAKQSIENSEQTAIRLDRMRDILAENGNTNWLYENGNIVVLNNGIEFAATYFILLLALFFIGAGRFTSFDHYLYNHFINKKSLK